jgi:uncharacterized protein (TIGR03437 family)
VDLNSPSTLAVVNSASFTAGTVAPQEIVTLFGSGINSVQVTDSTGNTQPATILSSTSGQANILIPAGLATGPATVTTPGLTTAITIANSAPGIYSENLDGEGVAAAFLYTVSGNESTLAGVFTCNPPAPRSCLPTPLSLGGTTGTQYLELYGTGIRGASSVQCYVAGQSVPVLYAGPVGAYGGLDQVNVSVPPSLAGTGDARVYVVADGVLSNVLVLNFQ